MNEHTLLEVLVPQKCCFVVQQGLGDGGREQGTSWASTLTGMGGDMSSPCVSSCQHAAEVVEVGTVRFEEERS